MFNGLGRRLTAICLGLQLAGTSVADAVADGCAVVTATKDGFVSLREGPGTHYREITRLRGGQFLGIDDLQSGPPGQWVHVNGLMDRTTGGDLTTVRIIDGWASARYLHPVECVAYRPPQAKPKLSPPPVAVVPKREPKLLPLPQAESDWAKLPTPKHGSSEAQAQVKEQERVLRTSVFQHGVVRRRTGSAVAPFRITTSAGSNYFFKLVRRLTNEEEMAGFIVGGRPLETKVPLGTYELRYAAGNTWINEQEYFGADTAFAKANSPLNFSVESDRVRGVEVQLIMQRGGNLRTSPMKRSEF